LVALVLGLDVPVVPDRCCQGEQALSDAGADSLAGASAVAFQAELAFEGVEDRLDPLPDPAEVAVAGRFVASVRAQQGDLKGSDLPFDLASGEALVGQHRRAGTQSPGLHGGGDQVQTDVSFADLRVGQTPRDGHPVRGGEQVQLESPVEPGVRRAVAVAGVSRQVRAVRGLPRHPARDRGGVDEAQLVAPRRRHPRQVCDRCGQQRRSRLEALW